LSASLCLSSDLDPRGRNFTNQPETACKIHRSRRLVSRLGEIGPMSETAPVASTGKRSLSTAHARSGHCPVRCSFDSSRKDAGPALTLCARNGLMHRSKQPLLFDHLVSAGEEHRRHVDAERLRGFEVDHKFELGRLLHRQVGRFGALKDAIDIGRRPPI
jgi:hypothetical protein